MLEPPPQKRRTKAWAKVKKKSCKNVCGGICQLVEMKKPDGTRPAEQVFRVEIAP
jgi:hypothetical protein